MNFEALKAEAKELGFTFELQEWESDDYTLDANDKECWYKGKQAQLKIIYPIDYLRSANYIDLDDSLALQRAIEEYHSRFTLRASDEKISQNTRDSMAKLKELMAK